MLLPPPGGSFFCAALAAAWLVLLDLPALLSSRSGARSGSLPAPPGLLRAGNGIGGAASPHRPASGLARSPSLKRELGIPQLEAAQSLRRAMSCYPELQGADAVAAGAGGWAGGLLPPQV